MKPIECSCGRTFSQKVSLERHCKGSGHIPREDVLVVEARPEPEVDEIYSRAMAVLTDRIQAQQAYDRQLLVVEPSGPSLLELSAATTTLVGFAGQLTRQLTRQLVGALALVARMLVTLLFLSGLLFSGVKLGGFIADHPSSEGPARSQPRQLIGANR